ncbi:MAG: DUF433 domain-containing protein [Bacteroidetes bacterium]|nr:DUF433 domain-containing protein [Bacteroidota bacterium]
MNWQEHIISNKKVLLGKPTIKGTRLSVDHLISLLAQGWTEQDILQNYPRLTVKDLQAVFAYIYDNIRDGLLYSQPGKIA